MALEGVNGAGELLVVDLEAQVGVVGPELGQGEVVHPGALGVADRVGDEPQELGVAGDALVDFLRHGVCLPWLLLDPA